MRNGTKDLLTGIVGIVALAGLATLLLAYGELSGVVTPSWRLDVRLDDGGGLRTGSRVTLNGVEVGEVARVRLAPSAEWPDAPVVAEVRIDDSVRLPANVFGEIQTSLLGGGAGLSLRGPLPYDPDGPLLAIAPPPTISGRSTSLASTFVETLAPQLEALEEGIEDLRAMARTYTRLGENLDDLVRPLEDGDPAAESNLRTTVARVNATLSEARGAIASASRWLGDEQLQQDVRNAVFRAGVMLEQTTKAIDAYAALAASLESDADGAIEILDARTAEVVAAIVPVAEGSSALLERLGELARLAAEGDGTIGRLLRDPDLHESLRESARQLETALRRASLLLEKIREEGLGVSFD